MKTWTAFVCLLVLIGFVVFCTVWLHAQTTEFVKVLEEISEQTEISQAAELFEEYKAKYDRASLFMHLIVYKSRFEEIDQLNDQLTAYFNEDVPYDDYAADLEKLKSLLRELYDKTNAAPSNVF